MCYSNKDATCNGSHSKEIFMLNYKEMIILDAEDLGEGGIGASYINEVAPVLRRHGISPAEIVEEIEPEIGSYRVSSQGRTYVIYSPEMDLSEGQNWGNATYALFDIVNLQLQDSPYRFYAINDGNDLGGMFLTKEAREEAILFIKEKTDWPYIPVAGPPWYGKPHDE